MKDIGEIMGKALNAVSEAVFPSNIYCISCGSLIDGTRPYSLCDGCVKKIHWIGENTCDKCGKALPDTYRGNICYDCMIYSHYFRKGFSCFTYGMYERELIFDFKYNGKGYLGAKFGDILYDRICCEDVKADIVIPVPISSERLKKRGYNQSAVMASHLAGRLGIPFDDGGLVRKKETARLRGLSPADREAALEGAFAFREPRKWRIKDKSVLLIDDIYTTGATADACSRALLDAGAAEVFLLTLASGGNR